MRERTFYVLPKHAESRRVEMWKSLSGEALKQSLRFGHGFGRSGGGGEWLEGKGLVGREFSFTVPRDRRERDAEVGCLLTVHVAGCLVLPTRNTVRDVNGRYFRIQRYVTLRLIPHST